MGSSTNKSALQRFSWYIMQKKFKEAKQILINQLKAEHSAYEIAFFYGRLYDQWALSLKEDKRSTLQRKAKRNFQKAAKDPKLAVAALRGLALVNLHQGRLKQALRLYAKAFQKIKNAQTYNDMGNIFRKLGNPNKAINYYQKAKEIAQGEEKIGPIYNLVLVFRELGDSVQSSENRKELEKMSKSSKAAKLMLDRLVKIEEK